MSRITFIKDGAAGGSNGKGAKSTAHNTSRFLAVGDPSPKFGTWKEQVTPKKGAAKNKREFYTANTYVSDYAPGLSMTDLMKRVKNSVNILEGGAQSTFRTYSKYYNRFKLPTYDDALSKSFAHVFFVRPDCNVLTNNGASLQTTLENNQAFRYIFRNSPEVVRELAIKNGVSNNDFMLSLSNKAGSFALSDEYINSDTYGKTYTGYKVAYGKNNIESKTAGSFSITYTDDRFLHVYQIHKLWVEYINGVYRGEIAPLTDNIMNKILDYASACYYILTAEDGETIIFWSKYYGVFPTDIPSSQYSYTKGELLQQPSVDVRYQYSFKEDYNPMSLVEFNTNARITGDTQYIPVYDESLGHAGNTWVKTPYVELCTDLANDSAYVYKLRFKGQKGVND